MLHALVEEVAFFSDDRLYRECVAGFGAAEHDGGECIGVERAQQGGAGVQGVVVDHNENSASETAFQAVGFPSHRRLEVVSPHLEVVSKRYAREKTKDENENEKKKGHRMVVAKIRCVRTKYRKQFRRE